MLGQKKIGQKEFLGKKEFLGQKKVLVGKCFAKIIFGQKKFGNKILVNKSFCQKNSLVYNFLIQRNI